MEETDVFKIKDDDDDDDDYYILRHFMILILKKSASYLSTHNYVLAQWSTILINKIF